MYFFVWKISLRFLKSAILDSRADFADRVKQSYQEEKYPRKTFL